MAVAAKTNDTSWDVLSRSWNAIVVALLIGFVSHATLNLVGLALGLATTGPTADDMVNVATLPLLAWVWWLLSWLAALALAGAIAGHLAPPHDTAGAAVMGGVIWAITAIVTVWFATSAVGASISGIAGLMSPGANQQRPQTIAIEVRVPERGGSATIETQRSGSSSGHVRINDASGSNRAETRAPHTRSDDDGANGDVSVRRSVSSVGTTSGDGQSVFQAIQAAGWLVAVQAARQLQKPEVRETLRRILTDVWQNADDEREIARKAVNRWSDGIVRGLEDDGALARFLEDRLLIDKEVAAHIATRWRDELNRALARRTPPGADAGGDDAGRDDAGGNNADQSRTDGDDAARSQARETRDAEQNQGDSAGGDGNGNADEASATTARNRRAEESKPDNPPRDDGDRGIAVDPSPIAEPAAEAAAEAAAEIASDAIDMAPSRAQTRALAEDTRRIAEEVGDEVITAARSLNDTLRDVFEQGGTLGPEARERAIRSVRSTLDVTRERAAAIVDRWQTRVATAASDFRVAIANAQTRSAEAFESGLDRSAQAVAWLALAAAFGWLAAGFGVWVAARRRIA